MEFNMKIFIAVIIDPTIAAITGFGMYWVYYLLDWNVFFSMFAGLLTSALVSKMLFIKQSKRGW